MFAFRSGILPVPAVSSNPFAVGLLRIAAITPVQFRNMVADVLNTSLGVIT